MIDIRTHRVFDRNLKSLPKHIQHKVAIFLISIEDYPTIDDMLKSSKLEKLSGGDKWYKARIGNYRIGFGLDSDKNILEARIIRPRGDIYKHFPPKS